MTKSVNFSIKTAQVPPETAEIGAVLKLAADVADLDDSRGHILVPVVWDLPCLDRLKYVKLSAAKMRSFWQAIVPNSLHDFGQTEPIDVPPYPHIQMHLEGGAGYALDGANLFDGWSGSIVNTTDFPQSFTIVNAIAYIRNGQAIVPLQAEIPPRPDFPDIPAAVAIAAPSLSPLPVTVAVPPNTQYQLEFVVNGGNWLQIIPSGGVETQAKGGNTWQSTLDADVQVSNGARVLIDRPGGIKLWDAIDGEWIVIIDPTRRLKEQSNIVSAIAGYTIGAGQLKAGVTAESTLDLNSAGSGYQGGAIYLICHNKNWLIDFVGFVGSPTNPTIVTKPAIEWVRDYLDDENHNVVELRIKE